MKSITKILTAAALAVSLFCGCHREEPGYIIPGHENSGETGYISFAGDPLSVQWDGENVNLPTKTRANNTMPEYFTVEIVNGDTGEVQEQFLYGQRGESPIAVPTGRYYIKVYSGEMQDTAWEGDDGQPTYGARTGIFEVTADNTAENPKKIDEIVCKLQSVKVSVWLEQSMAALCDPEVTEIKFILEDTRSVTFDSGDLHRYGVVTLDEDRKTVTSTVVDAKSAYLKPVFEENELVMQISTTYDGQPVDFRQNISSAAKAGEWRKIYLYIHTSESDGGNIVIEAVIETFVYDEVVNVEVSTLVPELNEDSIPDIDDPDAPRITAPGFTFHDITYVSASDYDTFGNYTKDANISIETKKATQRLAVRLESDNRDFAGFLSANGMLGTPVNLMDNANSSTLLARTTLKNWGFPSREEIEDNPLLTKFNINNFFKFIKDFEGNHTLTVAVSDIDGKYSRADMEIQVSTSGSSVDPTPGNDPRIEWVGYDIKKRHTVTDDLECKIDIYASKGIEKLMIRIEGNIWDEIETNLAGALPQEFDLCDTSAYGEDLGDALKGFNFPVDDEVKGKTALVGKINLSTFLLMLPDGESTFVMTLTDKEGTTVSESIMLLKN